MTDYRTPPGVVDEQSDQCLAICPYCGGGTGDTGEWVDEQDSVHQCWTCKKNYHVRAEYSVDIITTPMEPKP